MYYEKPKRMINSHRNQVEMICLDQLVPENHLVKKIEQAIDFEFIHTLTKEYYCLDNGRPCLDTIILFKLVLLNFLFGKNSIRATVEEASINMAYRWFLGISLTEKVPNYSTFSQNYIRRYKNTEVFKKIFTRIVTQIIEMELIDSSVIFVDGTHIKASANKHKTIKKEVKIVFDKYQNEMNQEIDEYREINGRDKWHDDDHDGNITIDEMTGEVKETTKTKEVTASKIDDGCGMFVKGEHERMFAYVDQVACDKNGWIIGHSTNPANMHDSKAFLPFFEDVVLPYQPKVVCADAAYLTGLIAKNVQYHGIKLLTPYIAPKGFRTTMGKKDFVYQMEIDAYLCPNRKILEPMNITKDGNIQYMITKKECGDCPYKKQCLKNYNVKTITRHLYSDCVELARDYRLSDEGKEIYPNRKQTIERIFAQGKEYHGLRFTRFRGLEKNRYLRYLLYACLNIKKLALLLNNRANKNSYQPLWG
jgi:transposase